MKTTSTEAERAAEQERRNFERLSLYRINREVDEMKKEVNERTRIAYIKRMSNNPSLRISMITKLASTVILCAIIALTLGLSEGFSIMSAATGWVVAIFSNMTILELDAR